MRSGKPLGRVPEACGKPAANLEKTSDKPSLPDKLTHEAQLAFLQYIKRSPIRWEHFLKRAVKWAEFSKSVISSPMSALSHQFSGSQLIPFSFICKAAPTHPEPQWPIDPPPVGDVGAFSFDTGRNLVSDIFI